MPSNGHLPQLSSPDTMIPVLLRHIRYDIESPCSQSQMAPKVEKKPAEKKSAAKKPEEEHKSEKKAEKAPTDKKLAYEASRLARYNKKLTSCEI
ncbi:uncharacterized protein A4U43_C08F13010 [Asparagus officinalis]|nr:uncharacterized protein A4U43_C08F13010 [Asparagus officinalis]